jgi:hypothetical protein
LAASRTTSSAAAILTLSAVRGMLSSNQSNKPWKRHWLTELAQWQGDQIHRFVKKIARNVDKPIFCHELIHYFYGEEK